MNNLEPYKTYFDQAYPDYADAEYSNIKKLVQALPESKEAADTFVSQDANAVYALIIPLIKIKNYKSQIPFPEEFFRAARLIVDIKNSDTTKNFSDEITRLIGEFLRIKGFQLPTVSAVLHFCHPSIYPIVDRNIEAACGLLSNEFPDEFDEKDAPILPAATTSERNKIAKYQAFIKFLSRIKQAHNNQFGTNYSYRELDKALMVYGVSNLRKSAENANNALQRTSR